ncbi:MAG: hypothetical protein E7013_04205, partial [Alphaproteobacteria bacterium]|nr:hypothetical protein [Alphaproteobacteria bacterium]
MIEMLGVLAVIGVLSIGAVLGIRYVLDKLSANLVYKEAASQAAEILNKKVIYTTEANGLEIAYAYSSKYIHSREFKTSSRDTILLFANNLSAGVCNKLITEEEGNVFTRIYPKDSTSCQDTNTVVFQINVGKKRTPNIPNPLPTEECTE